MNVYNQTASARGANQPVAIASDVSMNVYSQVSTTDDSSSHDIHMNVGSQSSITGDACSQTNKKLRSTVRPPSQRHPQPIQIVYQATITREHAQPSEPVEYLQSGHQHGASIIHYNQMNVCSQATNTGPTARTAIR
ncbi:uncharacterized protein LOC143205154 [Rhynchophorus ferrugineus]|uniref:uncharacterized protein LOC143205154 n=1 Tax=Rhynchophorus ferrugineus TaxID=354439 RepID=UPI003FCD1A8A